MEGKHFVTPRMDGYEMTSSGTLNFLTYLLTYFLTVNELSFRNVSVAYICVDISTSYY